MSKNFSAEELIDALVTFNADPFLVGDDVDAETMAEDLEGYYAEEVLPGEEGFEDLCFLLGLGSVRNKVKRIYRLWDDDRYVGTLCLFTDWYFVD